MRLAAVMLTTLAMGIGTVAAAAPSEAEPVVSCAFGHIENMQNPPAGPLPEGFNFNPTVDFATYAAVFQVYFAGCIESSVVNCYGYAADQALNPPYSPTPDGFDFTPTYNWTTWQATGVVADGYCIVLTG